MSDLTFTVVGHSETAARTTVRARDFRFVVDEPPALGGEDRGANPVEYLLGSFVGCVNVVAHLVAKERDLPIEHLEIEATGALDPARLFGERTGSRAGFKGIALTFRIQTSASDAAVAAWLAEVEARCPVNDNLSNVTPVELRTQVARTGTE
ncbi:MAG: OsmC family protein [Deltaproteobacteria bacterium]|nr:OsmC family protein [Deltaproteobacteria bacterium]